jgi:hypothetical protein
LKTEPDRAMPRQWLLGRMGWSMPSLQWGVVGTSGETL